MEKIITQATENHMFEGKQVVVTNFFHTKNPEGRRTIRTHYLDNMPLSAGGWLANTVTEKVVDGHGSTFRNIIPEHRVA